jgi:hypothetical protein
MNTKPLNTGKFNKDNVLRAASLRSCRSINTSAVGCPQHAPVVRPRRNDVDLQSPRRQGRGLMAFGWLRTCPNAGSIGASLGRQGAFLASVCCTTKCRDAHANLLSCPAFLLQHQLSPSLSHRQRSVGTSVLIVLRYGRRRLFYR